MAEYQDIINQLPIDQLAEQLGASPDDVRDAVSQAVPALLLGLDANAQDQAGATSLIGALGQHNGDLLAGDIDVSKIDTEDGKKIASNIFGSNEDAVVSKLGSTNNSEALIKQLIPILAPIVMAWLANKLMKVDQAQGQPQQDSQASGGILGSILGQVLGGLGSTTAPAQTQTTQPSTTPQISFPEPQQQTQSSGGGLGGGILGQILGGLLGGGKR